MILYQLAIWVEERRRIVVSMRNVQGDKSFLLLRMAQMDQWFQDNALAWFGWKQEQPPAISEFTEEQA